MNNVYIYIFDVSITFPLKNTTEIKLGIAAYESENIKMKNCNNCQDGGIIFLPFIAETFGNCGQISKDIIIYIYKLLG